MAYSKIANSLLPRIELEMQRVVSLAKNRGGQELHDMLAYHMGWEGEDRGPKAQGKRIRPMLVMLSAAAAGAAYEQALPAAAGVELLHNFSLIHDDIEDNSPLRRGRPTLWTKWGVPQAINAGDTLFTLAFIAIHNLKDTVPAEQALAALAIFQDTCLHLTQGQHLDMAYETRSSVHPEEYWPMIEGKTAALTAACTEIGAVVAGATPERQAHFREFGRSLGLAFQVLDDILGIWGELENTGKSAESDLVDGKKSFPVLFGLEQQGVFARRWAQGKITLPEVPEVAQMLADDGALEHSRLVADRLTRQALASLELAHPEGEAGTALRELADLLLTRQA